MTIFLVLSIILSLFTEIICIDNAPLSTYAKCMKDIHGEFVVHQAAIEGNLKLVQYLHGQGIKMNIKDKHGQTPMLLAALTGQWNIVYYLHSKIGNEIERSRKAKKGYIWFKRLRDETLKKQKSLNTSKPTSDNLEAIKQEILICAPVDEKKKCYSPCQKSGYDYEWCYDSSENRPSQWSLCSCTVKRPVLEFLELTKKQLLEPIVRSWTTMELVLLVITSILGAMVLITGIVLAILYWKIRNELLVFGKQEGYIANPIFAGNQQ